MPGLGQVAEQLLAMHQRQTPRTAPNRRWHRICIKPAWTRSPNTPAALTPRPENLSHREEYNRDGATSPEEKHTCLVFVLFREQIGRRHRPQSMSRTALESPKGSGDGNMVLRRRGLTRQAIGVEEFQHGDPLRRPGRNIRLAGRGQETFDTPSQLFNGLHLRQCPLIAFRLIEPILKQLEERIEQPLFRGLGSRLRSGPRRRRGGLLRAEDIPDALCRLLGQQGANRAGSAV